ncbi:hypothetical protein [Phaeacidiphilus oryzae]|uniref:hypothetical protein n=1 Tax=Phaeacidiphilus oryzae TaxID=348818 RepID=UPI00068D99E4|nr:hypothetical protein [Phaeacidiphilus oryzae]
MSQQKKPTKAERRRSAQEKIAAQRAAEAKRKRNIRIASIGGAVVVVAGLAVLGVSLAGNSGGSAASSGGSTKITSLPTGGKPGAQSFDVSSQLLATAQNEATGQTIDGRVGSNNMEQTAYHIHAHLQIYVNGQQRLVPYGVGIVPPYQIQNNGSSYFVGGGSKFYYLHTHDETGVLHIESPNEQKYTLGDFFGVWGQQLSSSQVGPAKGTVTAYVNGKKISGNPSDITLTSHENIQLNVGKVMPFKNFDWSGSGE